MLVVVSLLPVTQFSSTMRAVVSLVLPKQNYTNHRYTYPLGALIDTHKVDLIRKHNPNKAHSDITRDACSGLTSASEPVFKLDACSGLTCSVQANLYKPYAPWHLKKPYWRIEIWSNEKTSPNMVNIDMVRGACSGLTSPSDLVCK